MMELGPRKYIDELCGDKDVDAALVCQNRLGLVKLTLPTNQQYLFMRT
jgi:hypothetical protein